MRTATYQVVSPLGQPVSQRISLTTGVGDLAGKKIGLLRTHQRNGDVLIEALANLLSQRFKDVQFIRLPAGEGSTIDFIDESFADTVKKSGIDAAIVTVGC